MGTRSTSPWLKAMGRTGKTVISQQVANAFSAALVLPETLITSRYDEHMVQEMGCWTWFLFVGRATAPYTTVM
jgi:hypothetical protein